MTSDDTRPISGLTLDQAFERWGGTVTYQLWQSHRDAWQPVSVAQGSPPNERVRRHHVYKKSVEALQEQLRKMLLEGEVLASGINKGDDGRTVIKPSLWRVLEFSDEFDDLVGGGHSFKEPEFFSASVIPRNIEDVPDWMTALVNEKIRQAPAIFSHDPDYRHARLGELEFVLGDLQAKVVKLLHEASHTSDPWCWGRDLLDKAGSSSANVSTLFKRNKNWTHLIESDRHGHYRLRTHVSST